MNYMVLDFLKDDDVPIDDRIVCYQYFGTFSHSIVSMFEMTFANWAVISRFVYEKVDKKLVFFFMSYKMVMGIAILRVIYGVFLHVTFKCASSDNAVLIAQRKRE